VNACLHHNDGDRVRHNDNFPSEAHDAQTHLYPYNGQCSNSARVSTFFAPDGTPPGKIHLPEICANLCFGGARRNRLFMAASQSLHALYVESHGA
jgi:sugar lactone lactonase YvrE